MFINKNVIKLFLACATFSLTSCTYTIWQGSGETSPGGGYVAWTGETSPGANGYESTGKKCVTLNYHHDQIGLNELQLALLDDLLSRNPSDIKVVVYNSKPKYRDAVNTRAEVLKSYLHRRGFNMEIVRSLGVRSCSVIKVTANTWTKVGLPNCRYRDTNDSNLYHISNNFGCATNHNLELMVANKNDLDHPNNSPLIYDSQPFMSAIQAYSQGAVAAVPNDSGTGSGAFGFGSFGSIGSFGLGGGGIGII